MSAGRPGRPLLQARGLGFTTAQGVALFSGLDFEVRPGLTLLRGGEGRGKSTLLALMAGRLAPQAGQLRHHAERICHPLPTDPALDGLVLGDWLAHEAALHSGWRVDLAAGLADALGLVEHRDKRLHMLSTGSRRKAAWLVAAASGAALTLIDQPYAALDARSAQVMDDLFAEAAEDTERAWVVADFERPARWARWPLAGLIDLGD